VQGTTPVSGTVTVGNTCIPVTISTNPGQSVPVAVGVTPWDWNSSCSIGASSPPPTACSLGTNIGQGLIVQTVSCHGQFPPGDTAWGDMQYMNVTDSRYRDVEFPLLRVGPGVDTGKDEYSGVQNVSVPAMEPLNLYVVHSSTQATGTIYCTVAGFQY
jgi:hypothetical protein